ncbi:MAG TPA: ABC transporter permease subunit [Alphaproteobacteria bacterium]|nr:ABC transporter permease subunit [Alphaproteobacteria bacterium]
MSKVLVVFRREFAGYFTTPLAYVFLVVFLALAGALTFYIGNFFDRGQADLQPFFTFHPWLYLFLIPAISMRLWAEERKSGTIELLLTLPVSVPEAVIGKFLAAWAFTGVALLLTFPMWITVNVLGHPDNGVILAGYVGSFIMAGAFLAIGACMSALTKNQVIAFVVACAVCFLFILSGTPMVLNFAEAWLPQVLVDAVASFSFLTHFNNITKGVIELRDLVFLGSVMGLFLYANVLLVELKKAA